MRAFSIRYAYNGGGNPIHRVEITLNGGMDWHVCRIKERERRRVGRSPPLHSDNHYMVRSHMVGWAHAGTPRWP